MSQPVDSRVLARALHQGLAAFDAQHLVRLRGQRQSEVAEAAEPVDDTLLRLHTQQAQAARPTRAALMCGLTWVKSVGRKGMRMPNSGRL